VNVQLFKLNENVSSRDSKAVYSTDAVRMVRRYEYHWCDGVNYKKPTKLAASQYISLLMDWVEQQINNEELFPVTVGQCREVYSTYKLYSAYETCP